MVTSACASMKDRHTIALSSRAEDQVAPCWDSRTGLVQSGVGVGEQLQVPHLAAEGQLNPVGVGGV